MFDQIVAREGKNRWIFFASSLAPEVHLFLDWGKLLPPDVGRKHQREYLMKSAKQFIKARINTKVSIGGGAVASGTVIGWFGQLRTMIRWMIQKDIWIFSGLDGEDILEYLQFRVYTIRGDHHKLRNPTPIVQLLDDLWELRHDYVASLQVNPAQLHHEIARIVPAHSCRRWKALDESIALPLIRDAITWKNTHGEFVLYALQSIYETASKMGGVKLNDRRKRLRALYASLDDKPDMAVLRTALNLPHQKVFIVLRKALAQTEGACLIILLFLIGFRSQELLSLNVDTLRMDTLEDGEKIYRLSGVSAKKGGIGRTWVASPPIVDVIDYLTRLNAPIRRATGQKALFLSRIGPGYRRAGFGKRLTNGSITKRMREFANAPHRQGKPAVMRLHPHAARKTFARFVVLRDKSALEALSYHFGHTHRMITDGYYVGSDIELARMISEEGRRDLANSMLEIMRSGAIAGRAGRALQALRSDETMSTFGGRRALLTLVNRLIEQGVQLSPCDWGYCVYAQSLSACHGDENGPNDVARSPEVCSGCANFVVTEKHRIWWSDRYERDARFVSMANIGDQARMWVQRRMISTARILTQLTSRVSDEENTVSSGKCK